MEERKTYRLGEIASVQTGPFGSQLHNEDYVSIGTPIVAVEHLGARKFTIQNLPFVSDEDRSRLSKYSLKEGDIVFSRVGSVDRCSYVSSDEDGWLFSGRCLRVRTEGKVYPLYLYYYFQKESIKQEVRNIAVGATMPSINTKLLSDIAIQLPSYEEQIRIANILSVIDDKIELNDCINHNLEEHAQALYKSWFIDFEPFKDCDFQDTEIGKIPKGWNVMPFKSFITASTEKVMVGVLPEYSVTNNGIIPRDQKFNKKLSQSTSKNKVLRHDDLVFGMSRDILNWGIMEDEIGSVSSAYNVYTINQEIIMPKYLRLYIMAKLPYFNDLIGTAAREGQGLDKGALYQKEVYIPTAAICHEFFNIYDCIIEKQKETKLETQKLADYRDSILPLLLSGTLNSNSINV